MYNHAYACYVIHIQTVDLLKSIFGTLSKNKPLKNKNEEKKYFQTDFVNELMFVNMQNKCLMGINKHIDKNHVQGKVLIDNYL